MVFSNQVFIKLIFNNYSCHHFLFGFSTETTKRCEVFQFILAGTILSKKVIFKNCCYTPKLEIPKDFYGVDQLCIFH